MSMMTIQTVNTSAWTCSTFYRQHIVTFSGRAPLMRATLPCRLIQGEPDIESTKSCINSTCCFLSRSVQDNAGFCSWRHIHHEYSDYHSACSKHDVSSQIPPRSATKQSHRSGQRRYVWSSQIIALAEKFELSKVTRYPPSFGDILCAHLQQQFLADYLA